MRNNKESPEERRERLRQEEWKNNPTGVSKDSFSRSTNGSLVELVGGLGWKGTLVLIFIIILGFIIYSVFFS